MFEVSAVSRNVIDTSDPELAHEWLAETYAEHTPRVSGSSDGFRMRVSSRVTDMFRIDDLVHTMRVRAAVEPYRSLIVNQVRDGRYWMTGGRSTVSPGPGEIAMMSPDAPGRAGWDALGIQVAVLDLDATRSVAAELSGLPPERVGFGLSTPLDDTLAGYWARTVDYVDRRVLGNETAAGAPLLRAEAFRALAVAATVAFPNSALEAVLDPHGAAPGAVGLAAVRRATEFVDAHAGEDIGLSEIAAAARADPVGLSAAFRRHRDQSPTEYLRRARLEGVHRDLLAADPADAAPEETVAAIAARWGCGDPTRFADEYRRRYGSTPTQSLRRQPP